MNALTKSVDITLNKLDHVTTLVEKLNKKGTEGAQITNKSVQRAVKEVLREANRLINNILSLIKKASPSEIHPLINLIKKLLARVFKVSSKTVEKGLNLVSTNVIGVSSLLTQIPRGLTKSNKRKRKVTGKKRIKV